MTVLVSPVIHSLYLFYFYFFSFFFSHSHKLLFSHPLSQAVSWPAILESYGNSVDLLSADTKTLQLMLLDDKLNIMDVSNTSELFGIIVPRNKDRKGEDGDDDDESKGEEYELSQAQIINPSESIKWYEQMVYHQVLVDKSYAAVNIEIKPTNPDAELLLFINYKHKPLPDLYERLIPLRVAKKHGLSVNGSYNIFLGNDVINNRTGFFYLGVAQVDPDVLESTSDSYLLDDITVNENASLANYSTYQSNYSMPGLMHNYTTEYTLDIYTSGCYFFDYKQKIWSGEGCYVKEANSSLTYCKCNHLTSFGSG